MGREYWTYGIAGFVAFHDLLRSAFRDSSLPQNDKERRVQNDVGNFEKS